MKYFSADQLDGVRHLAGRELLSSMLDRVNA